MDLPAEIDRKGLNGLWLFNVGKNIIWGREEGGLKFGKKIKIKKLG